MNSEDQSSVLDDDDGFVPDFDAMEEEEGYQSELQKAEKEGADAAKRVESASQLPDHIREEIYSEKNLALRARRLNKLQQFDWPEKKIVRIDGEKMLVGDPVSELNKYHALDILFDHGEGTYCPFPYYDTFKGGTVDYTGETINKDEINDVRNIMEVFRVVGLTSPKAKQTKLDYLEWAKAPGRKRNSLIESFSAALPEWDGVKRIDTFLIDVFKPFDTELNRLISKYFWLSLYNRITDPGCQAPIAISLIGDQDIGKSYFSTLICRTLMQNPYAGPVKLDLGAKDSIKFLRSITGASIIANVGELVGLRTGEMNRIKDFITSTMDEFDHKFERGLQQQRQWITILDGNSYDSLQRDETGNRRFYPIFCFQTPDEAGQPRWAKNAGLKVDFKMIEDNLWQVMAECRAFMLEGGKAAYNEVVATASSGVRAFSEEEMKRGRGMYRDDVKEDTLLDVLMGSKWHHGKARGAEPEYAYIKATEVEGAFKAIVGFGHQMSSKEMDRILKRMNLSVERKDNKKIYKISRAFQGIHVRIDPEESIQANDFRWVRYAIATYGEYGGYGGSDSDPEEVWASINEAKNLVKAKYYSVGADF